MESGQKPKEIKVEFTCEVKDLPPTKREQRRDKRAKKVSSFCGRVSLVFLVLGLYFIFTTTNWGGGRIMLAAIIMTLSFLFFVASSMASSYKKFKIVKDYLSGESSTDDFNYI